MAVKKLVCAAAVLGLLGANAAALPEMGTLHAKSAALYAANGQELYTMNADEALQPASVTKIMTMLLTMEALERGEVTLDTMITGSEYACSMGGTQIWLEPGEQLTLDEMLKAIAVGSANDCAVAVAEHRARPSSTRTDWTPQAERRSRPRATLRLSRASCCATRRFSTTRASGWTASAAANSPSRTRTKCCAATRG